MSYILHNDTDTDDDNDAADDDRAMTIPRPFFENSRAKNVETILYQTTLYHSQ